MFSLQQSSRRTLDEEPGKMGVQKRLEIARRREFKVF